MAQLVRPNQFWKDGHHDGNEAVVQIQGVIYTSPSVVYADAVVVRSGLLSNGFVREGQIVSLTGVWFRYAEQVSNFKPRVSRLELAALVGQDQIDEWPERKPKPAVDTSWMLARDRLAAMDPGPKPERPQPVHLCYWCGEHGAEYHFRDYVYCGSRCAATHQRYPRSGFCNEQFEALRKARDQSLGKPDTVTVAGITMDRKRYEERCAAYAACDNGCAAFEPTSLLPERDFAKPEPEFDQPWSCENVDYLVTG